MSRAFVKDSDGMEGDELPELRISPHRNLVTREGLAQIDTEVRRLTEALTVARAQEDRAAQARHARDLRYWSARRASAELVTHAPDATTVRFGSSVTLVPEDGKSVTYRVVGEDEAAPAAGRISYVSPLGQAMLGSKPGDTVQLGAQEAEIVAIR